MTKTYGANGHVNVVTNQKDQTRPMFGQYKSNVLAISTISLLLDASNGSNFFPRVRQAKQKNTIQYQPIGNIKGQCLGHIKAMFQLFLQYSCFQMTEMPQIFTGESWKPNRRIQFNVGLMGPYKGHVWAMFWLFLQYICLQMTEMAHIFTGELHMPNRRTPLNIKLSGPYRGHVWAKLGPCFVFFYNIFASR